MILSVHTRLDRITNDPSKTALPTGEASPSHISSREEKIIPASSSELAAHPSVWKGYSGICPLSPFMANWLF
jgi:hypothetical protein